MESNQPDQNQDKGTKQKSTAATIGILVGIAVVLFVVNGMLKKSAPSGNSNVVGGNVNSGANQNVNVPTNTNQQVNQNINKSSQTNQLNQTTPKNLFDLDELKIGSIVNGFVVKNIEKVSDVFNLSPINVRISFAREMKLAGKYNFIPAGDLFEGNVCMFDFDESYAAEFPKMEGDEKPPSFCFSNKELAQQQFGPQGSTGEAEVIISNYEYVRFPAEGTNWATLDKVIMRD